MGQISVTPEDVRALGDALLRVKSAVEAAEGVTRSYRGYLGSGPIADQLDKAMKNWSDQRAKLVDHLDTLGHGARGAAQAYQDTETGIAGAAAGGTERPR
jgi:uncharacterized protein YukE